MKNDKVEHVLLHNFLDDENHAQVVSPGKEKLIQPHLLKHEWMETAFAVLIFVYTQKINFFKLFNYYKTLIRFHKSF